MRKTCPRICCRLVAKSLIAAAFVPRGAEGAFAALSNRGRIEAGLTLAPPRRPVRVPPAVAFGRGRGDGAADRRRLSQLRSEVGADDPTPDADRWGDSQKFDLTAALFCGGLSFDAYAEPPADSARWERGSKGMSVAFLSNSYTRSLYKGLVQVTPIRCSDLPDEDDAAEGVITGSGVDAYLAVAAVEGAWGDDIKILEKEKNHNGVRDLLGCAHVGRSATAWSNVDEKNAKTKLARAKKEGKAVDGRIVSSAYHIPSSWGKGGTAVWEGDPPFYLYVQDPSTVRIVFTVIDDDVVGDGSVVGSAHKKLTQLIPSVQQKDTINMMKDAVLSKLKSGEITAKDISSGKDLTQTMVLEWEGDIKLTSKPKKKDKNSQVATGAMMGAAVAGPVGAAVGGALMSMYEGDVSCFAMNHLIGVCRTIYHCAAGGV